MATTDKAGAPAGIIRRLLCMSYELVLLSAVLVFTVVLPQILLGAFAHRLATGAVLWTQLFVVLLLYFLGFWLHGGQTLAMKTWRIRLASSDNRPIRPVQALLRYLLCWPSILFGGVGLLWALIDRDKQFLHDRLAGTHLLATH